MVKYSAVRAVVVAMLLILGILFLITFISALRVVIVAKLVISGILSSISLKLALHTSFLITSFFTISLLKSKGTDTNLSTSNLST